MVIRPNGHDTVWLTRWLTHLPTYLLSSVTLFKWTEELNRLFEESEQIIIHEIAHGVEIFDKSRPTIMPCHRLEQIRYWILVATEALSMCHV